MTALPEYRFTTETLANGGSDLETVEHWWEDHLDRLEGGDTYDDVLDRMDGMVVEVDGDEVEVVLPLQMDDPVWKRLLAIGRRVRREAR